MALHHMPREPDPNMHAQNTFGAKSMGFKILLKPGGAGGAPVEHDFQLSGMAPPFRRPREQKRFLYA